jgi:hypothetical protein
MSLTRPLLDELFRPRWGGGWAIARVLFALAALEEHKDRFIHIRDAFLHPTAVFNAGPLHVADHVLVSQPVAYGMWALGLGGLAALIYGGKWAKPGILLWFLAYFGVVITCGLTVRVPERFIVWATAAFLLSPVGETGLLRKAASPYARYFLLVVYGSLYLSTGVMKSVEEPAWWDGTALSYDLVDRWHAGGVLDAWASSQHWVCFLGSWYTIAFEVGFVFFVGFPRLSRYVLLMGLGMHCFIDVLMEVGPLGTMAMSLYPVLLDPDDGELLWGKLADRGPMLRRLARVGG